jgi:hypothetical protein
VDGETEDAAGRAWRRGRGPSLKVFGGRSPADVPADHEAVAAALAALVTTVHDGTTLSA